MRVIFRTPPIPNVTLKVPNGPSIRGYAYFVAKVYEPGETVAEGERPKPMSAWRRDSFTRPDGSMHVPSAPYASTPDGEKIPAAVIPAAVLNALLDDTLLVVRWGVSVGVPR